MIVAPALLVEHVRFAYAARRKRASHQALDGVSFTLAPGDAIALLGPNGSGKSTLMRIIAGLLHADAGRIAVFDKEHVHHRRERIGVVFQQPALDPHLTVLENLRAQAALYGLPRREAMQRIDAALQADQLMDRRHAFVKTLSLGLARRVDLCRALLHQPALLLLDEPTVGLDPAARAAFLDRLETRRREHGLSLLMSTHLIDEADRCDHVILLHHGRIVAEDAPAVLRRQLRMRLVTVLDEVVPGSLNNLAWTRRNGVWRAALPDEGDAGTIARTLAEQGASFSIAPPTLADVFEARTGSRLEAEEAVPAGAPAP